MFPYEDSKTLSVCPYPEKRNSHSFVNISPTLVIDTSKERSSRVLQHGNTFFFKFEIEFDLYFDLSWRAEINIQIGLMLTCLCDKSLINWKLLSTFFFYVAVVRWPSTASCPALAGPRTQSSRGSPSSAKRCPSPFCTGKPPGFGKHLPNRRNSSGKNPMLIFEWVFFFYVNF